MPRLTATRRDTNALQAGVWVDFDEPEYEGAAIQTRGYTDAYVDARNHGIRALLRRHRLTDSADLPNAELRALTINCLTAHTLVGVRGFTNDDGTETTLPQFVGALHDQPANLGLYIAVVAATARAGETRKAEVEEASGN